MVQSEAYNTYTYPKVHHDWLSCPISPHLLPKVLCGEFPLPILLLSMYSVHTHLTVGRWRLVLNRLKNQHKKKKKKKQEVLSYR